MICEKCQQKCTKNVRRLPSLHEMFGFQMNVCGIFFTTCPCWKCHRNAPLHFGRSNCSPISGIFRGESGLSLAPSCLQSGFSLTSFHGFTDSQIHRFTDSRIHGFTDSRIHGFTEFMNSCIHVFTDSRTSRIHVFANSPICGFTEFPDLLRVRQTTVAVKIRNLGRRTNPNRPPLAPINRRKGHSGPGACRSWSRGSRPARLGRPTGCDGFAHTDRATPVPVESLLQPARSGARARSRHD